MIKVLIPILLILNLTLTLKSNEYKFITPNYELVLSNSIIGRINFENPHRPFTKTLSRNKVEQKRILIEEKAKPIYVTTKRGLKAPAYFIDRNSDCIIVLGQGLGNKEQISSSIKLFPDFDVIIVDYQWCSYPKTLFEFKNPIKRMFLDETDIPISTINFLRNQNKYKKIIGLGMSYSSMVLTMAQAKLEKQGLNGFDYLILDSIFYSTKSMMNQILNDPKLFIDNRNGGAPYIIKKLSSNRLTKFIVLTIWSFILGNDFEKISMKTFIPQIKIPILFIHGQNDLLVPVNHVYELINESKSENLFALITPFEHVGNHEKNPSLYSWIIQKFVTYTKLDCYLYLLANLKSS